MEWTDEGIVVGVRRHGESSVIADVLTLEHGRHLGLVRGGGKANLRPVLQMGNHVRVVWRARLEEHLGHYSIEGLRLRAGAFLTVPHALYGLTHLCSLVRLLPERDPHPSVYHAVEQALECLGEVQEAATHLVRFELLMLAELGFGLDLDRCAATGRREDLIYVSPRSGRAVSREAGAPWQEKLLKLPGFLYSGRGPASSIEDIGRGFELTGFFLSRHVLEPRGQLFCEARAQFVSMATRGAAVAASPSGETFAAE